MLRTLLTDRIQIERTKYKGHPNRSVISVKGYTSLCNRPHSPNILAFIFDSLPLFPPPRWVNY